VELLKLHAEERRKIYIENPMSESTGGSPPWKRWLYRMMNHTHLGPYNTTQGNHSLSQESEWSHDLGSDHRKSSGSEVLDSQELSLTKRSHVLESYTTKLPTHSANTQGEPAPLPVDEKSNQNNSDTPHPITETA
jgi:hypothetical protein